MASEEPQARSIGVSMFSIGAGNRIESKLDLKRL